MSSDVSGSKGSDSIETDRGKTDQKGQTRLLGFSPFSCDKILAEQSSLTLLIGFASVRFNRV
jgi:hypothetical protein